MAAAFAILAVSCSDSNDDGTDYPPQVGERWSIRLALEHETGADLLDPDGHCHINWKYAEIVYRGEAYPLSALDTRLSLAPEFPNDIRILKEADGNVLVFDGIYSKGNYRNETFTINWRGFEDGEASDVIKFDLYENEKGAVVSALYVNGEPVSQKSEWAADKTLRADIIKSPDFCGWVWDFVNNNINLRLEDADGGNLLDDANPNRIPDSDITVTYKDEKYEIGENPETRAWIEQWKALFTVGAGSDRMLVFGEFQPQYTGESFTLDWGDGTQDEIKFDCETDWTDPCNPQTRTAIYVNGQKQSESLTATVVKSEPLPLK